MIDTELKLNASDVKALNRALRNIEPNLVKEMRSEIKAIAKPVEQQIKDNIPNSAPMSGMAKGRGRLSWLGDKKPKKTAIYNRIKASGRSLTTSLVSIAIKAPVVAMADMAGRVNKSRAVSREYTIRLRDGSIVKRKHSVTTQGLQMISKLTGKASRYGWPALENRLDAVVREIDKVIQKYYDKENRSF